MGEKSSASSDWCDLSVRCRCLWRWNSQGVCFRCHDKLKNRSCVLPPAALFFLAVLLLSGLLGAVFAWLLFTPFPPHDSEARAKGGCQPDNEGSWAIGVFRGKTPFTMKPIEMENAQSDGGAAWPVANPVLTCAAVSNGSHLSNFVADPFLFMQGNRFYLFYETKNSVTLQGDIGVAESVDGGSTWTSLGIALDEEWHLSYPYVFEHAGQIYMMPEGSQKGDLRLYRAVDFPLEWTLDRVLIGKPLVDAALVKYDGLFWILGSDHTRFGCVKNGELEIWYSSSLSGLWSQHGANPIHNRHKSLGSRNAGRPIFWDGNWYRFGQDCGETYGRRVRAFKIVKLDRSRYKEVEVPLGFVEPRKGRYAWNGMRYHHIDAHMLPNGDWIAAMDGDRVPSGDIVNRRLTGLLGLLVLTASNLLLGVLLGFVRCALPPSMYLVPGRSDVLASWYRPGVGARMYKFMLVLNRSNSFVRGRVRAKSCFGFLVLALSFSVSLVAVCVMVACFLGGNGAEEPYPIRHQYSQFTMVTMTYEARLWNLKMYIRHYSRCASVREIVVVWNKGQPPDPAQFDSAVPVRIRVEKKNSLNNRFRPDPHISTRAVLELDDDIMVTCDDVERGFKAWREHPGRIVGYYPRLVDTSLVYKNERYARSQDAYNMMLTGAAFMDSQSGFEKYWSKSNAEGRAIVDQLLNCEDILYNFILANSSSGVSVQYIHPSWAVDTSKLSSSAISRNTQSHYEKRTKCLKRFSDMFGGTPLKKQGFHIRQDSWDM